MITCKSLRIFHEPGDPIWSSGENQFILINENNF